jgi:hypothetical protein
MITTRGDAIHYVSARDQSGYWFKVGMTFKHGPKEYIREYWWNRFQLVISQAELDEMLTAPIVDIYADLGLNAGG